jgi:hypothetical protein
MSQPGRTWNRYARKQVVCRFRKATVGDVRDVGACEVIEEQQRQMRNRSDASAAHRQRGFVGFGMGNELAERANWQRVCLTNTMGVLATRITGSKSVRGSYADCL